MPGQDYKSLRDIARDIQANLQKYAPIDTGNLRSKLRAANSINSIIGKKPSSSKSTVNGSTTYLNVSFEVEVGPSGAEYGKWFNEPPAVGSDRRKKLKRTAELKDNWNFGERAIEDAVQKKINEYIQEVQENVVDDIYKELENL